MLCGILWEQDEGVHARTMSTHARTISSVSGVGSGKQLVSLSVIFFLALFQLSTDIYIYIFTCYGFEELNDESGKPIWKNRVESWKEKKKEKKASAKKAAAKAQAPPVEEQIMDEKE